MDPAMNADFRKEFKKIEFEDNIRCQRSNEMTGIGACTADACDE